MRFVMMLSFGVAIWFVADSISPPPELFTQNQFREWWIGLGGVLLGMFPKAKF